MSSGKADLAQKEKLCPKRCIFEHKGRRVCLSLKTSSRGHTGKLKVLEVELGWLIFLFPSRFAELININYKVE